MADPERLAKLLGEFQTLLSTAGGMEPQLAAIYALGIEKGTITSGDVVARMPKIRQNTAGDALRRLSKLGFLTPTVPEQGTHGGRGHAQRFQVVPPQLILRGQVDRLERFRDVMNEIAEHLELLPPRQADEDGLWQLSPSALLSHFCGEAGGATKSIEIHSNDCSWISEQQVLDALRAAKARGVRVSVFATELTSNQRATFKRFGISRVSRQQRGQPYAILDQTALYLPVRVGQLRSEYGAVFTKNSYWVKNFVNLGSKKDKLFAGER
jgi:hypothetical protein